MNICIPRRSFRDNSSLRDVYLFLLFTIRRWGCTSVPLALITLFLASRWKDCHVFHTCRMLFFFETGRSMTYGQHYLHMCDYHQGVSQRPCTYRNNWNVGFALDKLTSDETSLRKSVANINNRSKRYKTMAIFMHVPLDFSSSVYFRER